MVFCTTKQGARKYNPKEKKGPEYISVTREGSSPLDTILEVIADRQHERLVLRAAFRTDNRATLARLRRKLLEGPTDGYFQRNWRCRVPFGF